MTFYIFAKFNLCKISHLAGLRAGQAISAAGRRGVMGAARGNPRAPGGALLVLQSSEPRWALGAGLAAWTVRLNTWLAGQPHLLVSQGGCSSLSVAWEAVGLQYL